MLNLFHELVSCDFSVGPYRFSIWAAFLDFAVQRALLVLSIINLTVPLYYPLPTTLLTRLHMSWIGVLGPDLGLVSYTSAEDCIAMN